MKRLDIEPCLLCGKGVGDAGLLFYEVKLYRHIIDVAAVQRRYGMELMMGGGAGGAALAEVLGPSEDLAKPIGEPTRFLICERCTFESVGAAEMIEKVNARAESERWRIPQGKEFFPWFKALYAQQFPAPAINGRTDQGPAFMARLEAIERGEIKR